MIRAPTRDKWKVVITAPTLDKKEAQRLIVRACTLHRSRHFVLQIAGPNEVRRFLGDLLVSGMVNDASLEMEDADLLKDRGCLLNLGFTYRGLEALGVGPAHLAMFQHKAPAFAEGACRRAAHRLGDAGASAATCWDGVFRETHAHVLITLHADRQDALVTRTEELRQLPGGDGLKGWEAPIDGAHLTEDPKYRKVHFGLRDMIADPGVNGFPPQKTYMHEPGEFLLGYANDDQFNPWLMRNPSRAPDPWLLPLSPIRPEFFWNGSFAAFRKMQQHEKEFRDAVKQWAGELRAGEPKLSPEYVKAKLTGRWEHGQLVKPGEEVQPGRPPDNEDLDAFDFADDPEGKGCPFGSHVRRMNPRGGEVVPKRKRTLIRRGMPYGAPYDEDPTAERGLLGLFFCASLEDQFEHLLSEWGNANPMGPVNHGTAKDPFIGGYGRLRASFDIPVDGQKPSRFESFKPFVTTRGTLYAFFPGMSALRALAGGEVCA